MIGQRLEGASAIVTGGNGGIGLGIAKAFALEGADVLIAGRNQAKNAAALDELRAIGGRVDAVQADLSSKDACHSLVDRALASFGKLDILVNGAAIYTPKPFLDYSHEEFERVMAVNLHGPFHLSQAALLPMAERGYGRIINIASTAGKWASRNQSAYNVSKHGLVGLTRCIALEFAGQGITCNAICPGLVSTDMTDQVENEQAALTGNTPHEVRLGLLSRVAQGRYLDTSECGHLAVYLASKEAAGMTGQSILLDGGMLFI